MILIKEEIIVNVLYWMPDYNNILQQFMWSTEDVVPEYPRVKKFLNFWHENIEAVISEVQIANSQTRSYRSVDWLSHLQEH